MFPLPRILVIIVTLFKPKIVTINLEISAKFIELWSSIDIYRITDAYGSLKEVF